MEKSNRELVEFVVCNGRVSTDENGLFDWDSLANEIEYEAQERGWDEAEIHDLTEWAWNACEHNGR